MVQVDKRSHLVLFKQNQRNHDPYTSELANLANRHDMMGTVSKLYVSNNTWIYVYIKKTWQNFNSNSNSREFQLQFQLQLREFQLQLQLQLRQVSWISTPTPTPTPGVSTPTPTPANLQNINSNSNSNSEGFNSNSNSNSGVGVGVEPNSNSNSGVDPNPGQKGVFLMDRVARFLVVSIITLLIAAIMLSFHIGFWGVRFLVGNSSQGVSWIYRVRYMELEVILISVNLSWNIFCYCCGTYW